MDTGGEWVSELGADGVEQVRGILRAAKEADGRPEGTEPADGGEHFVLLFEGDAVAYAHLDTAGDSFGRKVAELIVHPAHRRRGFGTRVARAIVQRAGVEPDKLRVWAHGDHPAAARVAEHLGLTRDRELLILHVDVPGEDWPEPTLRDGVRLRTFVPGRDENAVIRVNARAFDWHPEQGALTADDLRADEAQPWFDPAGFFLAENAQGSDNSAGDVVGFHWTKVHAPVPGRFGGKPIGEVYVVGVDPGAQGGGLGKALTLAGLRYLRDLGLEQVILYVEGDNAPALAVYSKLGFTRAEVDVQYGR
ncbi:mycothiol synthase [Amycolatopsis sp. H20-H5]|uniref:mycothiol synthase n=1 Tax=Amycolatopsis sp. H20-H5 TaxID=3046309 RepID=UPI002DB5F000|nr:mycothiol synthase [Amycolatopsis sp. H20-H5]MEC3982283.1 mycothiol synthase [Amycolatopsis sp. H20-H5]